MYTLIRYPVGVIVEAMVLAGGRNRLRVAAAGFPDVIELKFSGSQWFAATHQPVELEFLMADAARTGECVSSSRTGRIASAAGATPTYYTS